MKIAMIGQKGMPAIYGGVERHVEELSKRLVKLGHEVYAYTRPYYSVRGQKKYQEVNLVSLPSVHTKHLDAISHTFFATIHALFQDYDIIHYHAVGPSLLSWIPRIFKPGAKVISTFHCIDRKHQKWGWFARLSLRLGELAALKFAHKTITVSKTLQQYCREAYDRDTEYIPNGINRTEIIQTDSDIQELFNLEKDSYILAVSRLVKHKGLHYLIKAYRQLNTDKKLVIVGDSAFTDDYVKGLKSLASGNSNIIFTGWQSGKILDELFSNAYLFVHPSESEGLPLVILEAMSFANCVLASDIPENLEVIETRNQAYGFSFKNKEINDLRKQLQYLIDTPEEVKKIGGLAREYVVENYNWLGIAEQTDSLYEETVKQPAAVSKLKTALKGIRFFHW
ncbi:MAG: glycosyltransferase family 4 protein [bacterium]